MRETQFPHGTMLVVVVLIVGQDVNNRRLELICDDWDVSSGELDLNECESVT